MKEEIYDTFATDMYEIWNEAFGKDVKPNYKTYLKMFDKLEHYWNELTNDDSDLWCEGFKRICQAVGFSFFAFNTDEAEQDPVINDLVDLIFNHPESLTYKRIKDKMKIKQLEQDFE